MHISAAPDSTQQNDDFLNAAKQMLHQHGLGHVLVGWEANCSLPDDVYIACYDSMSWTRSDRITTNINDVNPVSPYKAILKLRPSVTTAVFKDAMIIFNSTSSEKFRELRSQDGRILWQELAERKTRDPRRPEGAPDPLPTDIYVNLMGASPAESPKRLCLLVQSALTSMQADGYNFGDGTIAIYNGVHGAPALLTFPPSLVAKGFYGKFADYVWESEDGTQSITVQLINEQFRNEMARVSSKVALANAPFVRPEIKQGSSGAAMLE